MEETTSTNGVGSLFSSGTAYVSIPSDLDREQFIKRCLKTQTLFLRGESGEKWKNVFCPSFIFGEIDFPETSDKRGSLVAWVKQPKHNIPIVVAAINLKGAIGAYSKERQIKLFKSSKSGSIIDLDGRADDASLDINVISSEENKGKIRLKIANPNKTAELDIYVSGQANIFAENRVKLVTNDEFLVELRKPDGDLLGNISYKSGVGFSLLDQWGNEFKVAENQIYLKEGSAGGLELELTDLIMHLGKIGGTGTEPVLLGDKTKTVLDDLISALNSINTQLATIATTDAATASGLGLTYPASFATLVTSLTTTLTNLSVNVLLVKSTKVKTL